MLATMETRKWRRKGKGKTEDKVKKEYSGSDKRSWLRGRRPAEDRKGKRKKGPSERRTFAHIFPSAQHALLPTVLIVESLASASLPGEAFFDLPPPPSYTSVFLNLCLIHFLKLTTVCIVGFGSWIDHSFPYHNFEFLEGRTIYICRVFLCSPASPIT